MFRQNSVEHAFESDNNDDSKSDVAAELHFDSEEESEHVRRMCCTFVKLKNQRNIPA